MSAVSTTGTPARPPVLGFGSARALPRARARLRPREPVLRRRTSRNCARRRLPDDRWSRPSSAGAATRWPMSCASSAAWPTTRRPPPSPSTCTILGRRRGRPVARRRQVARVDAHGRAAAGEVFAAGHAEGGNDVPCYSRPPAPSASTAATASTAASRSAASPRSGPRSACTRWTRATRTRQDRACLHAARAEGLHDPGDLGHARHARNRQPGHHPRRRLRAGQIHRPRRAGWRGGRRPLHPGDLRLGADRLRQRLLRHRPAGARPDAGRRQDEEVAGHQPDDGLPSGRPGRHRRDGAGPGGDRAATRRGRRGVVARGRPRRQLGRSRSSARSTTPSRGRGASWTGRSTWAAASASSSATSWSGCSATRGWGAFTRPTPC